MRRYTFSPTVVKTWRRSAAETTPEPSLSMNLNISRISFSSLESFLCFAITVKNAGKSMTPAPRVCAVISLIIALRSASEGLSPRDLI